MCENHTFTKTVSETPVHQINKQQQLTQQQLEVEYKRELNSILTNTLPDVQASLIMALNKKYMNK
jgi:hypothetical protein